MRQVEVMDMLGSLCEQRFFFEPNLVNLIMTRSRHEKKLVEVLEAYEVPCYLPLYRKVVKYRKGRALHDLPLFPNYVFAWKLPLSLLHSKTALSSLVQQVNVSKEDSTNLIDELKRVRSMLATKAPVESCDELVKGQMVKLKAGPMKGVEGIVIEKRGITCLVINIQLLGRSVQVQVDPADLKKS